MAETKRGRPKGSRNVKAEVNVIVPACPFCGSHERTAYKNSTPVVVRGVTVDGRNYHKAIKRSCVCLNCNEPRTDRFLEITND